MEPAASRATVSSATGPDDLLQRCESLARSFAARAEGYDRAGSFPAEDFEEIKQAGLLGIMVPRPDGGLGADFLTYTQALERLSTGNASTGLTFNMHNIVMGGLAEVNPDRVAGRHAEAMLAFRRWAFSEAVHGGRVFASATSEPGSGARLSKLRTVYQKVDGGFLVRGVKSFVSMAGYADFYVVAAMAEGSTRGEPVVSYLVVGRDDPGVRFDDDWDVLGMRATSSRTMHLEEVLVPAERLFLGVEGMAFYKILREPHWLVGGYNGVYLGISSAAFEFLLGYLRKKGSAGDPVVQHQVGEIAVRLGAARAATYEAAALIRDRRGTLEANLAIHRAKYLGSELGPWLTSRAIRLCGGSVLRRSLPLERLYRDSRCGGLMPARSDDCLSYIGKAALGIDVTTPEESYW